MYYSENAFTYFWIWIDNCNFSDKGKLYIFHKSFFVYIVIYNTLKCYYILISIERSSWVYSVKVKVAQPCPTLCDPMGYTVHGILQARILEWVAFPFSRGSLQPGIKPRSPTLQADSLPAEPQGPLKNTEVGSLSLFQRIFLTQELNRGLLHCGWILYQLSYWGNPCVFTLRK